MKQVLLSILWFVCSTALAADFNSYIGYWKLVSGASTRIIEISKDGDTFLFNENTLGGKRPMNPMPLMQGDSQLIINIGIGPIPLGLVEDEQVLAIGQWRYKKISATEAQQLLDADEKADNDQRIQDKKKEDACNSIKSVYKAEADALAARHKEVWDMRGKEWQLINDAWLEDRKKLKGKEQFAFDRAHQERESALVEENARVRTEQENDLKSLREHYKKKISEMSLPGCSLGTSMSDLFLF